MISRRTMPATSVASIAAARAASFGNLDARHLNLDAPTITCSPHNKPELMPL